MGWTHAKSSFETGYGQNRDSKGVMAAGWHPIPVFCLICPYLYSTGLGEAIRQNKLLMINELHDFYLTRFSVENARPPDLQGAASGQWVAGGGQQDGLSA
jgi:hypothetical protein